MNNGKHFSRMLQSETDTWTTAEQQRTYKKQHKPDNTIVRNKTQIVLGYQLKYP